MEDAREAIRSARKERLGENPQPERIADNSSSEMLGDVVSVWRIFLLVDYFALLLNIAHDTKQQEQEWWSARHFRTRYG